MKKIAIFLTALSLTCFSATAQAQPVTGGGAAGSGAQAGSSNAFAWGIGIGGIAVIATVAGVVAASSANDPTHFHN